VPDALRSLRKAAARLHKAQNEIESARAATWEEIVRARQEGATLAEIAGIVGITRQRVKQILEERGIE
jgi:DNA-directed RNA polymerase sigma subunit (sigma70/sigma32)